jgi:hypothetical protein
MSRIVSINLKHKNLTGPVLPQVAKIRQQVARQIAELNKLTLSLVDETTGVVSEVLAQTVKFDARMLGQLRIIVRLLCEPQTVYATLRVNHDNLTRRQYVEQNRSLIVYADGSFSATLHSEKAEAISVEMTMPAALALIRYLVPRLLPGYPHHGRNEFQTEPVIQRWEESGFELLPLPPTVPPATPPELNQGTLSL